MELLEILNSLSPLAVIGLLAYIIYLQVSAGKQVETLRTNDLHEMPQILETLQRIEVKLGEEFAWLRARINGKH